MSDDGNTPSPEKLRAYRAFEHFEYQIINYRRLEHLTHLGLDLRGRSVLELAAGIGSLTSYFINRGCAVTSIEARPDSLEILRARFPTVTPIELDLESAAAATLPQSEIVFSYGYLYHTAKPEEALARMSAAAQKMLLLETCVWPSVDETLHVGDEGDASHPAAGFYGIGNLASRSWIVTRLKRAFPYVYLPTTQPNHPHFPIDWDAAARVNAPCRAVFVGSHAPIDNPLLVESDGPQRQTHCP